MDPTKGDLVKASRIVLGIVLIGHGFGHVLGVLAPWLGDEQWSLRSWLLADPTPEWIGMVVYAIVAVLFVLAGLAAMGLVVPEHNLRWLTEIAAVISLLALLFWWYAFPSMWSNVGAIIVNVVVLVGALPQRRPQAPGKTVGPATA